MSKIHPINLQPRVSSLSVAFKRATAIVEDVTEVKREHRTNLKFLIDKYLEDVQEGKAEGIRNAKELVEVVKADMLLIGEATERKDEVGLDEIRVKKVSQALDSIDMNDGNLASLINTVMTAMNDVNDELDDNPGKMKVSSIEIDMETDDNGSNANIDVDSECSRDMGDSINDLEVTKGPE